MGKLFTSVRRQWAGFLALFLVLAGGTTWAATELDKNEVKSKHIGKGQVKGKDLGNDAVTSPKVADGSLQDQDFAAGELPQGPQGPQGLQGEPGTPGAPGQDATNLFAYIRDPGSPGPDTSTATVEFGEGVTAVSDPAGAGHYTVTFNRSLVGCVANANAGFAGTAATSWNESTSVTVKVATSSSSTDKVEVRFANNSGASVDTSFLITVFC